MAACLKTERIRMQKHTNAEAYECRKQCVDHLGRPIVLFKMMSSIEGVKSTELPQSQGPVGRTPPPPLGPGYTSPRKCPNPQPVRADSDCEAHMSGCQ